MASTHTKRPTKPMRPKMFPPVVAETMLMIASTPRRHVGEASRARPCRAEKREHPRLAERAQAVLDWLSAGQAFDSQFTNGEAIERGLNKSIGGSGRSLRAVGSVGVRISESSSQPLSWAGIAPHGGAIGAGRVAALPLGGLGSEQRRGS